MRHARWVIFALYIIVTFGIYKNNDRLFEWISSDEAGSLPIILTCALLLAVVPIVPFGIIGAILGARYGWLWGGVYNVVLSTAAAAITYFLFRYLLQTKGRDLLMSSPRWKQLDDSIQHNAFMTILVGRLIPIVPAFLINCYAGIFRISFITFMLSTVIGKIPAMLVFAFAGDQALSGTSRWMAVVTAYAVFLAAVYFVYKRYGGRRKQNQY